MGPASAESAWREWQTDQPPACTDSSNKQLPLEAQFILTVGLNGG